VEIAGMAFRAQLAWSLAALETQVKAKKTAEAQEAFEKRSAEAQEAFKKRSAELQEHPKVGNEEIVSRAKMAVASVDDPTSPTFKGLEAILGSITMLSWTAFEVLVADLWCACLDERPRLAFIALDAEPLADDDAQEQARKRRTKVRLPASLLREPGFDFSRNMGKVVRLTGKWDFARRDQARHAYTKVLPELSGQLSRLFDQKELQWLCATRNAIVHNGGIADSEFVKLVRQQPLLSTIQEGGWIPLNGEVVGDLCSAAFIHGKSLLAMLDDWLNSHQT
jgi:hypothetical protein